MELIFQYGLPGFLAYGAVAIIALIALKRYQYTIQSDVKFWLLFVLTLIFLFIPKDLANVVLEQIKDAFAIALGISALNEGIKRV